MTKKERVNLVALIAGNMAAASIAKGEAWSHAGCVENAVRILQAAEAGIEHPAEPETTEEPEGENV